MPLAGDDAVSVPESREGPLGGLTIEDCSPVRAEGFDVAILDGYGALVACLEFAAALNRTEMDPVGRAIASAVDARRVDKSLCQQQGVPVQGQPVPRQE